MTVTFQNWENSLRYFFLNFYEILQKAIHNDWPPQNGNVLIDLNKEFNTSLSPYNETHITFFKSNIMSNWYFLGGESNVMSNEVTLFWF